MLKYSIDERKEALDNSINNITRQSKENYNVTEIIIKKGQIKSLKKAKLLAKALDTIEKEIGINVVKITLDTMFICPDINKSKLNKTPMQKNIRDILYILDGE